MGPVTYHEFNVITAQFGRDENNGFLQFNNLYTGGNERQLLRDNGYNTPEQITQAIIEYKKLFLTTREIANLVGCSQSHVSKTLTKHYTTSPSKPERTEGNMKEEPQGNSPSCLDESSSSSPSKIEGAGGSMKKEPQGNSMQNEAANYELSIMHCTLPPNPMPKIKLEPDITPIYDASRYLIDPYGRRITIEEYNEYYSDESQDEAP